MARYIDADALIKHIKDVPTWCEMLGIGWRPMKYPNGMYDCNDIINSIENAPTADVVETKRISEILAVLFENNIVEKYIPNTANAGSWEDFLRKACSGEYGMLR